MIAASSQRAAGAADLSTVGDQSKVDGVSSPSRRVARAPQKRGFWRSVFSVKGFLLGLLTLVLLGVGAFAIAWVTIPVPSPNDVATSQTSIIYYSDGKTELGRMSGVNRQSVPLSQVPASMQHAILAAEDRSFYENPGFSPSGIGRAIWAALTGGPTQGGSTITQQYVKNYFLSQDQTITRKVKELIISLKVEQQMPKDQILQDYLNTIYYGRGAYGVQAAAGAYFNKPVDKLTVGESALLASVIRAPSLYDPSLGAEQKKNAQERVGYVLNGMVDQGWLTPAQRRQVTFPAVQAPRPRSSASGPNGYLVAYVKNELAGKVGLSPEDIDRGGLHITTTISRTDQQAAIKAVQDKRPSGGKADGVRVGLVSIKPGDGAITSMYGGANYREQPYNAATQAQLQGGSTFKVFTLVAALEQGISTRTMLNGSSPQYFEQFKGGGNPSGKVSNFGGEQLGTLDVRSALAHSSNTAFAELNLKVGPKATVDAAVKLGLPANTLGLSGNPANVFGTASPRVIDMATAYATLAAGGKRAEPYMIAGVTSSQEGATSYTAAPQVTQAVSPEVAADAVDAMQQVVQRGTAAGARELGRPAAGKTGTTDENRAVWFDGFTPQLATAVGMYLPDAQGNAQPLRGIAGLGEVTGGTFPVRVWTAFMQTALEGLPVQDFPQRSGIGDGDVSGWSDGGQQPAPSSEAPAPSDTPSDTPSTPPTPSWSPTDVPPTPTDAPTPSQRPTRGDSGNSPSATRAPNGGNGGNGTNGTNGGNDNGRDDNGNGGDSGNGGGDNGAAAGANGGGAGRGDAPAGAGGAQRGATRGDTTTSAPSRVA